MVGQGSTRLPRRFGRNTLSNYAMTIVSLLVAVVTTPVLTHHLGLRGYGVWVITLSVISYLEVLELGLGNTTVVFVARHASTGDHVALQRMVNTSFAALTGFGVVALIVAVALSFVLPGAIHVALNLRDQAQWLLILLGLDMAVSIPMDTFGGGLIALQRYDLMNASLIVVSVCHAVSWVLILTNGGGLIALGITTVAISIVGQFSRFVLFRRLLPNVKLSPRMVDWGLLRTFVPLSAWNTVGSFLGDFLDYVNVLILSVVRNAATAGIFSVGERLSLLGGTLAGPMTAGYFPHVAELSGQNDVIGLREATLLGSRLVMGTTIPLCLVIGFLAQSALHVWVGPAFEGVVPSVRILAVAGALASVATMMRTALVGAASPKVPALAMAVATVVDVTLTVILGIQHGMFGVALASLIAGVVYVGILVPIACRKLTIGTFTLFRVLARSHLLPLVVAGAVGWSLSQPLLSYVSSHGRFAGICMLVATGSAILITYLVIFVFTGLSRKERRDGVARLRRIRAPEA